MDPYTGELLSLYTHRNSFFYAVFATHRWLLNEDIGKIIDGLLTLEEFLNFGLVPGPFGGWDTVACASVQRTIHTLPCPRRPPHPG